MNTNGDISTGSGYIGDWKKEMKVFPENFEIEIRKIIMSKLESETRVDGETAFVVKDLDSLMIGVMEFIQNNYVKKEKK